MEGDSDGHIKCYPRFVMGTGKPAMTHIEMRPNAETQTVNEVRKRVEGLRLDSLLEMFPLSLLTMRMVSPKKLHEPRCTQNFSKNMVDFANTIVSLQVNRHFADHGPFVRFTNPEAKRWMGTCPRRAIRPPTLGQPSRSSILRTPSILEMAPLTCGVTRQRSGTATSTSPGSFRSEITR